MGHGGQEFLALLLEGGPLPFGCSQTAAQFIKAFPQKSQFIILLKLGAGAVVSGPERFCRVLHAVEGGDEAPGQSGGQQGGEEKAQQQGCPQDFQPGGFCRLQVGQVPVYQHCALDAAVLTPDGGACRHHGLGKEGGAGVRHGGAPGQDFSQHCFHAHGEAGGGNAAFLTVGTDGAALCVHYPDGALHQPVQVLQEGGGLAGSAGAVCPLQAVTVAAPIADAGHGVLRAFLPHHAHAMVGAAMVGGGSFCWWFCLSAHQPLPPEGGQGRRQCLCLAAHFRFMGCAVVAHEEKVEYCTDDQ